ncbi:hypothetical protein MLD38_027622 [Melastoma candidum]|uniref:Uncharacterized protein n=1 Tax=Melastoma candidum TaxID=119954 RepID=A0ACB9P264_9MYRT|nr:hypothetical protein MLD38_027622 [Melastoma candidum]
MVGLPKSALDHLGASPIGTRKSPTNSFDGVPDVVDLSAADACFRIVRACEEYGFFKVVKHGVPPEVSARLEEEAFGFFGLPQDVKEEGGPPDPFGYGTRMIGLNGDVGWVEFLLLPTDRGNASEKANSFFHGCLGESFRRAMEEYTARVKELTVEVLELIAEGLGIKERDVLSSMAMDERNDGCFRMNHYPPLKSKAPHEHSESDTMLGSTMNTGDGRRNLVGFGEHTDPQIISVLRSNDTAGLEIRLRDGRWVSVPSDQSSFFVCVGDTLQVLTNGRLRSVKHRVLVHDVNERARLSMIYFGSPARDKKISPLPWLLKSEEEQGGKSMYKEFTWGEYKDSAYKTNLSHDRLSLFEISP